MRTGFYRAWEPLFAPSAPASGPLLVLAPHPDDEVIGAAGLILGHRDADQPVRCVVMTDGKLGDATGVHGDAYPQIRKAECRRASEELGGTDLVFLDLPDFGLAQEMAEGDPPACVARLAEVMRESEFTTLALPSPYELHPDHRATAIAGLWALEVSGCGAVVLAYEIGSFMPGNMLLDVTASFPRKRAALECYVSQIEHHDLVTKMEGLNVARSANVDDPLVTHCEAYLKIEKGRAAEFLAASERLLVITGEMTPPVPWA